MLHPSLSGANQGASVQPYTPQPVLPQPGTPSAPHVQAHNNDAMTILHQLMGGGAPDPQQQQQAPGGMSPIGGMGGANKNNLAGYLGLDPTYTGTNSPLMEGLFGNAAGYGGLFGAKSPLEAMNPITSGFRAAPIMPSLSAFTLPNFGI